MFTSLSVYYDFQMSLLPWVQFPFTSSTSLSSYFKVCLWVVTFLRPWLLNQLWCMVLNSKPSSEWVQGRISHLQCSSGHNTLTPSCHGLHSILTFPPPLPASLASGHLLSTLVWVSSLFLVPEDFPFFVLNSALYCVFHPVFVMGVGGRIHINLFSYYYWKSKYSIYNTFPSY